MTELAQINVPARREAHFLRPAPLIEAIEIEKAIVLPGLELLRGSPERFALVDETLRGLDDAVERHDRTLDAMIGQLIDAIGEDRCAADQFALSQGGLTVRAAHSLMVDFRRSGDEFKVDLVALAFLFVALHVLTDPTNCGTASRRLNLVPPPLHRDKALIGRVFAHALEGFDPVHRQLLAIYIGKASHFFALPDATRWGSDPDGPDDEQGVDLSIVRYNPHALRTSCLHVGLDVSSLRIASAT
ncbi:MULTISPECIES: hypothetical protein [unclassified Gordonia (in: high G+C Gram-positive bacteria)]